MSITDLIPWKRNGKQLPIRRDSERTVTSLQTEINRLFEDFWRDPFSMRKFGMWTMAGETFSPQVDLRETEKAYVLCAELPGLSENDIEISLENQVLRLKGEKRAEREEKEGNYYVTERSFGSFYREFALPNDVDEDNIEASFKNGVLNINLPKHPEAVQRRKRIAIKKS